VIGAHRADDRVRAGLRAGRHRRLGGARHHTHRRQPVAALQGQQYLVSFVLPNFYFHVTTAYDILRHCGVAIGKRDFLGAL
jgi:hypothetical protein